MHFGTEKFGYSKSEVDNYLKKVSMDNENVLQEQRSIIASLKRELEEKSLELLKFKEQGSSISDALVAAVETARQIEENSKNIYDLEIRRVRSLYDKWQGYLDEMMDRYPQMKEHFDPTTITTAFKKSIDEVLSKNEDETRKNGIGIRNLISKMNGAIKPEVQKTYTVKTEQKSIKRKPRPSLQAVNKKMLQDAINGENNRIKSAKTAENNNLDKYNSLAEQFLNTEISENLEQTAYSKTILKKKKETGFDLKEALTPTEDLMDIMKAFNIEDD